MELACLGYRSIIAIASEPGPVYRDMFQTDLIPDEWNGIPIAIIQPDRNVATVGTDFTSVTEAGLVSAYEYGKVKGREFLQIYNGY